MALVGSQQSFANHQPSNSVIQQILQKSFIHSLIHTHPGLVWDEMLEGLSIPIIHKSNIYNSVPFFFQ